MTHKQKQLICPTTKAVSLNHLRPIVPVKAAFERAIWTCAPVVHEEVGEVAKKFHSLNAGLVHIIANGVVAEIQDLS